MKKNKIVVLAGMALLMVGTILNVHDALNGWPCFRDK